MTGGIYLIQDDGKLVRIKGGEVKVSMPGILAYVDLGGPGGVIVEILKKF